MQHDYFPVRLGDMPSSMKYVGLSEENEGIWLDGNDCLDGSEEAQVNGNCNGESVKASGGPSTTFRVTTKYLNHTVLTLGYKVEEFVQINNKRKAKGVSVAYITDHEPYDHSLAKGGYAPPKKCDTDDGQFKMTADQSHGEFFQGVDIVFHDCQYLYSEYGAQAAQSKENWGHSTVEYVVDIAFHSDVKHLLLFHHDPQRKDDAMDDLVAYARSRAEELEKKHKKSFKMKVDAAKEGDVLELDPFEFASEPEEKKLDMSQHRRESITARLSATNQSIVLGSYKTDMETLSDMLQKDNSSLSVKVLHSCNDIMQYCKDREPSLVVLDQDLFGCTGLQICEEIRTNMGAWGKDVPILMVASKSGESIEDQQRIEKYLNADNYIKGVYSHAYFVTRIQMALLRIPLRWRRAPLPPTEDLRVATLRKTGLLDSGFEERFDRITRLAKAMFNVPIALVSLVDHDRQWFKACCGLPEGVRETPRDHAFCAHAILQDDVFVVADAFQDERFADNPLVSGPPHVRFYAGCPLRITVRDDKCGCGTVSIGTICIIDSKPRDFSRTEER
jgi:CheY-like chemotaxis protein